MPGALRSCISAMSGISGISHGSGDTVREFLQEAIELEKGLSELYSLYRDFFPEDGQFWERLSLEKKDHAVALISRWLKPSGRENMPMDTRTLMWLRFDVRNHIIRFRIAHPEKNRAYQYAMGIEESAEKIVPCGGQVSVPHTSMISSLLKHT